MHSVSYKITFSAAQIFSKQEIFLREGEIEFINFAEMG